MNLAQILLVLGAVGAGFFAKGVTGIGGPLVAIPVLAAFMGVEYAVAVIAIPTMVANSWLIWGYRDSARSVGRYLGPLLTAGTVGVVLGAWILVTVDERVLSLALAFFVFAYLIWSAKYSEFRLEEQAAKRLSIPVGLVGGAMQGATGISAPVIATYMHSLRLPRAEFVFAVSVPFLVLGTVQVVSLAGLGVYTTDRAAAAALAVIPVIVVLPIAMRVGSRFSQRAFEITIRLVLALSAVRLVFSVFQ